MPPPVLSGTKKTPPTCGPASLTVARAVVSYARRDQRALSMSASVTIAATRPIQLSAKQPAEAPVGVHPPLRLACGAVLERATRERHLADDVAAHRAGLAGSPADAKALPFGGFQRGRVGILRL